MAFVFPGKAGSRLLYDAIHTIFRYPLNTPGVCSNAGEREVPEIRLSQKIWIAIPVILCLILIPVGVITYYGLTTGDVPYEDSLIALIVGVSFLSALIVPGIFLFWWLRIRSIRRNGVKAQAKILRVRTTGMRINNSPLFELDLEVHPPYDQSFETTTEHRLRYTDMAVLQPGAKIEVYYIPGTTDVVIDAD